MKRLALLAVLCLLLVPAALADGGDITVTASNVVIGPETVSLQVNWDPGTDSFTPGTTQYISTNGPLGLFTWDGVGGNQSFNWIDSSGDVLDISNNNEPEPNITFPQAGIYNAGYVVISCVTEACAFDMGGDSYVGGSSGSLVVTNAPAVTPEPSTLLLLTGGLFGLLCFSARMFPQFVNGKS
jgi:hypothetical protein